MFKMEIKTMLQDLSNQDAVESADATLNGLLADGWVFSEMKTLDARWVEGSRILERLVTLKFFEHTTEQPDFDADESE